MSQQRQNHHLLYHRVPKRPRLHRRLGGHISGKSDSSLIPPHTKKKGIHYCELWIVIASSFCCRDYVHEGLPFQRVQFLISLIPFGTKFNSGRYFSRYGVSQGRLFIVILDVNQNLTPDPVIFPMTIQKIFPPWLPVTWFLFPLKKVLKNLSMARYRQVTGSHSSEPKRSLLLLAVSGDCRCVSLVHIGPLGLQSQFL